MSFIDWNAAALPSEIQGQNTANSQQQLALMQAQRSLNALRGVNINDPNSVNAGLNSSIQAGNLEQAKALMDLNWTRSLRSQAPGALNALQGVLGGSSPSSDQQQQAPQDQSQQPQPNQNQQAYQAAQGTMTSAAGLIRDMQALPDPASRQALFDARVKDPEFQNIDPDAIASVRSHLADSNFADENLGQLLDHYQGHAANFGNAAAGGPAPAPATLPGAHPTNSWAMRLLENPQAIQGIDLLKGAGLDYTNLITAAQGLVQPQISKEAELQYAPALAAVSVAQAGATETAKNIADFNTLPAVQGAVAEATAKGSAAGTLQDITMPDGSHQRGVLNFSADGKPELIPLREAPAAQGGAPGPVIKGQSTAGAQVQQGSGQAYNADLIAAGHSQPMQIALRKVVDLLPNTNVGPGVEVTNGWRSFIMSQLPAVAGLIPGGLNQAQVQTANTNELQKYMVQIAGAQAAQYGQGTNDKLAFASSGNPHLSMDKASALDVTRMALALQRADMAKPYLFSTTGAPPGDYSQFASNYARTVDPRAFMLDVLPTQQRASLIASIKTPQDRERFQRGVQAAEAAGFYNRADLPR